MKKITFVFILLFSGIVSGFSQTYNMSSGTISNACSGTFYDPGGSGAQYSNNQNITETFCAQPGQYLTINFTQFNLAANDFLYVYNGTSSSDPMIGFYSNTVSPGMVVSAQGGCLTFVFTSNGSGTAAGWTAGISCSSTQPTVPGGDACGSANPFCTGTNYSFPNNTNQASLGSGGIYGCLGSTPNPIWYYFQIANSGPINIGINQTTPSGTPIDVDFVLWGPFTSVAQGCGSLAATNTVSCSYSASASETATVPSGVTGQYYILLLTNYSNTSGNIAFSQSGGTGSTNCGILCSVTASNNGPVCTGGTINLSASTPLTNPSYSWSGSGIVTAGNTNSEVANATTAPSQTYTVTVTSGTATCNATTTVTVNQTPVVNPGTASTITCSQPNSLLDASTTVGTITWNGPGASGAADPFNASQAGTFTATATNGSCVSTATISVTTNTVAPVPSYNTPDGTVLNCIIQAVTLDGSATPSGATVAWTGPSGALAGNPVSVSAPGTYTVTATNPANGCTANTTVVVTANAGPPNISVSSLPNTTIISCNDSAIVLTGSTTTPNTVDGWSGPSGGIVGNPITVTTPGQYTYQVTDTNNGCQSSTSVSIAVDTAHPTIQISAPNTIITCAQTSVVLNGTSTSSNTSFAWTLDSIAVSGNPITVTDSGTYVLVVTNAVNGCTSTMSQAITKDLTAPDAAINAPNTVLNCLVSSVSLLGTSNTAGATFAWNGPTGASTNNPLSTNVAGTYTLTVTNPNNGCTSTQTVAVTEDIAQPNVSYTTPQGTTLDCGTPQVSLNGASTLGTAVIGWAGSSGALAGNPATVGSPDTYTVTVTNPANGCASTATVAVTSNGALPDISYGTSAPNITCAVTSITLTGASITPNVSIVWSNASGPMTGNPVTINTGGSYTLTVTDLSSNCAASTTALIGTDTLRPNVNILPSTTILTCASTTSNLTGTSTTPGATYNWSGPSGAMAGNPVTANTSGTYSLTVTNPNNGCTRSQTVTLTTNTVSPTVSIASNTTQLTCATTTIPLTATGNPSNVSYSWSGMGVGSNPVMNANNPGTYVVSVTDPSNGCSGNTSVNITQNITAPPATAGGGGPLNCNGNPIPLTGSSSLSGVTFVWTGPSQFVDSTANSSTTVVGNYTLTVTNPANGCTGTGITTVTTNTNVPNVNAGLNQNIKCNKQQAILTGTSNTPNATFSWAAPAGVTLLPNTTTAVCTTSVAGSYMLAAGNYTLTVTNPATGCVAHDQVLVTATPAPNAGFTAIPVEGYVPLTVSFTNTSTNSNNYSWNFDNGGIGTATPAIASTANPSSTYMESGTYQVMMITSASGACKDTAYITIEVKDITEVVIPNIFTPNGDQANDFFAPSVIKAMDELTIDVWDRWGKHVKTFDGLHSHWDGNGSSDGTYFYIAKGRGKDKTEIEQTGFVMLVRGK